MTSIARTMEWLRVQKNAPKDDQSASLAIAIGQRVRHERQARGWTLGTLAEAAGVSRRMLINVEHGAANPSVGTLLKIGDALGIGLPALVELPQRASVKITRAGEGATLWKGECGGRGVLVAGTEPPDVVELWDWTIGPGDRHESQAHTPGTRELLQILEGSMTLSIGGEVVYLDAGDAVAFHGDVDHAYWNETTTPVRFTLCVFEPGVGIGR